MSDPYKFPDDPEVFERVIQHFHNTSVAHWEARMARYACEASTRFPAPEKTPIVRIAAGVQKSSTTVAHARPPKRARGVSGK